MLLLFSMLADAGSTQLQVHQHEGDGVRPDVAIEQCAAPCRRVEEALVEGDPPRRMLGVAIAPDSAGVVGARGETVDRVARRDTEIVENVVDADEEGDRTGRTLDEVAKVEPQQQQDAEADECAPCLASRAVGEQGRPDAERHVDGEYAD